jgi:hypothetical protein
MYRSRVSLCVGLFHALTICPTTVSQFAYGLPGSLPPVQNFDPLGFSSKADEETVKRYRECEIMHGKSRQVIRTICCVHHISNTAL